MSRNLDLPDPVLATQMLVPLLVLSHCPPGKLRSTILSTHPPDLPHRQNCVCPVQRAAKPPVFVLHAPFPRFTSQILVSKVQASGLMASPVPGEVLWALPVFVSPWVNWAHLLNPWC